MRRINFKFALALFLGLTVAAGGFHFLHVIRYGQIADELRWQLERSQAEGRSDDAIRYATQYLEFRPDDVEMMRNLAEWLRDRAKSRKQYTSVLGLYERILRIAPQDPQARRKACELSMALGNWAVAIDNLQVLLQSSPEDAELCEQYGYCQQVLGKYVEASEWYQRAMKADPKRVSAYVRRAALLSQQLKRPEEALALVEQASQANPNDATALTNKAQYLRSMGKLDAAAECIRQARKLAPEDAGVLLVSAEIEQSSGHLKASRELFETGMRKYPKNSQFVCNLAWQLSHEGRPDLAVARLREARQTNPRDVDILTLLGDLLAQDGQIAPLESTLKELTELNAPPDRIQYVEARLLMRRGRWTEAAATLDKLRISSLRMPALYRQTNLLLAQCQAQLGDFKGEQDSYRRLLEFDPNAMFIRLELARSLARQGQLEDARRELLVVCGRPEVNSRLVLETTAFLAEKSQAEPRAWKDFEKAIETCKLEDGNANPVVARAALDLFRGRASAALPLVEKTLRAIPSNLTLHVLRARLNEQIHGLDRALANLTESEALIGDQADLRVLRGRMFADRLDKSHADALATLVRGVERFAAEDRLRILGEVINGFRAQGDASAVSLYLDLLAQLRPDDLPTREAQFALALNQNDPRRLQAVLADVEAIEGKEGAISMLLKTQQKIWDAGQDASKLGDDLDRSLINVSRMRPTDPLVDYLRGRLAEVRGQKTEAREFYLQAFQRGLAARMVPEFLSLVPGQAGNAPKSIFRDSLPLVQKLRPETHHALILAALPLYDAPARPQFAQAFVALAPKTNSAQLIWMGRVLARVQLDDRAEELFRLAAVAAPDSSESWQTLVALRASRKDQEGTRRAVQDVREKLAPLEGHLVVGRAMQSTRDFAAARQEYEAARVLKPDDTRPLKHLVGLAMQENQPAEARKTLEAMIALPQASSREDVQWARRTLAIQLAMVPSLPAFEQALALLDANKVAGKSSIDDQRARVLVLASQKSRPLPGGQHNARQEAIRILEDLHANGSNRSAEDMLLLARLYRAENDGQKMQQVRNLMRNNYPEYYQCNLFLAQEALRDHDLKSVEQILPTLRRQGPGQFETTAMEFQFLVLNQQHDLARRLLDDFVAATPDPRQRGERALRSANLVYDFLLTHSLSDRPTAAADLKTMAIRMYRPEAGRDPLAYQRLVTLLAQQAGGTTEAITIVQRGKAIFGVEVSCAAFVQVLRHGNLDEAQRRAVGRYLEEALAQAPQSSALMLSQGEYFTLIGEHGQAIQAYRNVLQREPDNVVALNNLAWVLSYDRRDQTKVRESLAHIQRAIDLIGPLDELLDTRARILFESGRLEEGLRDMCEAVTDAPSASRLLHYATMLRKAGRDQQAERALAEARRYGLEPATQPR